MDAALLIAIGSSIYTYDQSHCLTPFVSRCVGGTFTSLDFSAGYIFAATRANVYRIAAPPAQPSCSNHRLLVFDATRDISAARASPSGTQLYYIDGDSVWTAAVSASVSSTPTRLVPASTTGVAGSRLGLSLASDASGVVRGLVTGAVGSNATTSEPWRGVISASTTAGVRPATLWEYPPAQLWLPMDLALGGVGAGGASPKFVVWIEERLEAIPLPATIGLQLGNLMAPAADGLPRLALEDLNFLGRAGDAPPDGSRAHLVATDVRASAFWVAAGGKFAILNSSYVKRNDSATRAIWPHLFDVIDVTGIENGVVGGVAMIPAVPLCGYEFDFSPTSFANIPLPLSCNNPRPPLNAICSAVIPSAIVRGLASWQIALIVVGVGLAFICACAFALRFFYHQICALCCACTSRAAYRPQQLEEIDNGAWTVSGEETATTEKADEWLITEVSEQLGRRVSQVTTQKAD